MPFNFAVFFGSRNKGHGNIKGFTVSYTANPTRVEYYTES